MREDRLQFKEINELTEWLLSLIDQQSSTTNMITDITTKLTNKEYDNNSDIFNPVTKDKLTQKLKELKDSNISIATDIEEAKQKRSILIEERKELKSKYKRSAISIRYKSNKTKYANIEVGELSLGRKVVDIKFNRQAKKEFIDMYIELKDGSVYTASVGLDKETTIKEKI